MPKASDKENLALYRKYRPQSFADVVGQDHIVSILEGSVKLGRIAHAYLFSGSRGTGKTSVARILAKALDTADEDIYEIDAASNRGIDDIRSLREGVSSLPFRSTYKIYILDEVHMLSKDAWNALLKTLEEPPSHVVFILATTETEKVPETVVSRCQVYSFKKPSRDILKNMVTGVAKKEGLSLDHGVAELIALMGDGSFRDTQGILQKVASASPDKKITTTEVERAAGAPQGAIILDFVKALNVGDVGTAIKSIGKALDLGVSMKTFAMLAIEKVRYVLLLRNVPAMKTEISGSVSEADSEVITLLANEKGITSQTLLHLLTAYDRIGMTAIESLPLELAVLEVCKKQ
jgi:DNA polymerase-3 subunit gamma/tau